MGCIFSYCKKKDEECNETFLFTNRHCIKCNKVFTPNEYHRHIYQSNQENEIKNGFINVDKHSHSYNTID